MIDRTIGADGTLFSAFLVARLDWLWDRICGGRRVINGVKIDVQGMEIEAVKGMLGLLGEFGPKLVLEVHRGVDRGELLDLIESVGYCRRGEPVDPAAENSGPLYLDDRSYSFALHSRTASKQH
jgi:hypothetical protein